MTNYNTRRSSVKNDPSFQTKLSILSGATADLPEDNLSPWDGPKHRDTSKRTVDERERLMKQQEETATNLPEGVKREEYNVRYMVYFKYDL